MLKLISGLEGSFLDLISYVFNLVVCGDTDAGIISTAQFPLDCAKRELR